MPFWSKFPGDPTKRELWRHQAVVDEINDLEEEIAQLTDEQLPAKALVVPSLGSESFGVVLTLAYACAAGDC